MKPKLKQLICVVAIVKGDERFIEEWLVYHSLIGVDHFFIYDNDPGLPLRVLLEPYQPFVTVIDWPGDPTAGKPGRNLQTRTYTQALSIVRPDYQWVSFLDVDEFIVLRRHESIGQFLSSLGNIGSVRLNWHVFGHNGHYEDPEGLITAALTRRMAAPSPQTKAITRTEAVATIESAHLCRLKAGWRTVTAAGRRYSDTLQPGQTDVAHINHYQCRSFLSWMGRVERGDVSFNRSNVPAEHAWRLDEHLCLRQFVETFALNRNELVDDYMLRYQVPILRELSAFSRGVRPRPDIPRAAASIKRLAIHGSPTVIPGRDKPRRARAVVLFHEAFSRIRAWSMWRYLLRDKAGS